MRVLIVYDRPADTDLLSTLEAEGHYCDCAKDESECVQLCDRRRYDVAFVDLESPHIDGPRLCRILSRRFPETHVIPVSAGDDDGVIEELFHSGATAYLMKPVASDTVSDVMASLEELHAPQAVHASADDAMA